MIIPLRLRRLEAVATASALVIGLVAAVHYARLDLTLSHYDARGHLVVARRIFDNLTPGWWQIGAIWLPLPHLLNALPVQVDGFYRSGFSAVAISIASFAVGAGALARLVLTLTSSTLAAALAALVFVLNPNVLYLQATPMAEPLLLGLLLLAIAWLVEWYPARGRPLAVLHSISAAVVDLSGPALTVLGAFGLLALLVSGLVLRNRMHALVPLALATTAALPFSAFVAGHPHRVRYMVPLLAAQALGVGALVGLAKRAAWPVAALVAVVAPLELHPLDASAPMMVEAQWDRPSALERQRVTGCLRRDWDGEVVLASMGSLGHYMQELSHAGFALRDFIHEGNGEIWRRAVHHARPFAGWVLISEREDNRDALAAPARDNAAFLEGFERVCEGGLVALYRRVR